MIRTMAELNAMSDEEYIQLMPDALLRDPEAYCRKLGRTKFNRFGNVIRCELSCKLYLTDGSIVMYEDRIFSWEPTYPVAACN